MKKADYPHKTFDVKVTMSPGASDGEAAFLHYEKIRQHENRNKFARYYHKIRRYVFNDPLIIPTGYLNWLLQKSIKKHAPMFIKNMEKNNSLLQRLKAKQNANT